MKRDVKQGTCSNCKRPGLVAKIGSVQCCYDCIDKFNQPTNIRKAEKALE